MVIIEYRIKEVAVMNCEECIEKVLKNTNHTLKSLSEILGVQIDDLENKSSTNSVFNERISLFTDFLSKYSLFI